MPRSTRLALSLALLFLASNAARADVITLIEGGRIEGEIVKETDDEVTLKVGSTTTAIKRDAIKAIEKKLAPAKEFEMRRALLAPEDVAGRIELARFALEKRLPAAKAGELALEAFAIDPTDPATIELLRKKLDYKFEKTAWVAPDAWYPEHGYVRHGGSWITLELAADLDAQAAVKQAKADETAAEKALAAAEKEVLAALEAESLARKELERIKADLESIDVKIQQARTDLQVRENDVARAAEATIVAQRDYTYLATLPKPSDTNQANDLNRRVATAQELLAIAQTNELKARKRRDETLGYLNDLTDLKAEGPKRVAAAQSSVEAALAKGKVARENVPVRRDAAAAARKHSDEAREAEIKAKLAAQDRRAAEAKAEAERDEALKNYKKPAEQK